MNDKWKPAAAALVIGGVVGFGVKKARQEAEASQMPWWGVMLVTLVVAAVIREAITAGTTAS